MALLNVLDVNVLDNPSSFTNPFQFEITFECLKHLPSGTFSFVARARSVSLKMKRKTFTTITDLEWKVVYVGSASDGKFDQELDSVLVGPIPVGVNKFVFHVRQSFSPFSPVSTFQTFRYTGKRSGSVENSET